MIVLLILSVLLVALLVYLFNQWSRNRMPSRKQRDRVLREVQQDMDGWSADLVKIHREELDLFSLTQEKQVIKRGTGTTAKGTFTTIFHEPVVSYSYRRYLGKQVNALLYARTADHDYVYWTEKGKTRLEIDGQPVGTIDGSTLLGERTGMELARIEATPRENYLPVSVGKREVAALKTLPVSTDDPLSQRAFEFIPDDLNDKEEQLLLSLTVRELVGRSLG
ncbi:type II secretory pathway pseudopilin PulG [Lewinella marina]|uniref:Uncharacterized protein n=1 Tax=Neolewinella marina TaxID=438751 RepID=A0A2G0CG11_9BACT|nr:hypothetical protein [Neolewinella marina]NJB86624.1 type II secretory pathway pseudopilin PulG [Neolewinella marina]PHK98925.1 hypothetical protein CGL56_05550 [Neolewinella marina]